MGRGRDEFFRKRQEALKNLRRFYLDESGKNHSLDTLFRVFHLTCPDCQEAKFSIYEHREGLGVDCLKCHWKIIFPLTDLEIDKLFQNKFEDTLSVHQYLKGGYLACPGCSSKNGFRIISAYPDLGIGCADCKFEFYGALPASDLFHVPGGLII